MILRFVNLSIIADSSGGWFGTDVNNRAYTGGFVGTGVGIGIGVGFYNSVSISVFLLHVVLLFTLLLLMKSY